MIAIECILQQEQQPLPQRSETHLPTRTLCTVQLMKCARRLRSLNFQCAPVIANATNVACYINPFNDFALLFSFFSIALLLCQTTLVFFFFLCSLSMFSWRLLFCHSCFFWVYIALYRYVFLLIVLILYRIYILFRSVCKSNQYRYHLLLFSVANLHTNAVSMWHEKAAFQCYICRVLPLPFSACNRKTVIY